MADSNGNNTLGEPSVLDWVKSILKGKPISIPAPGEVAEPSGKIAPGQAVEVSEAYRIPNLVAAHFRLPAALFLGLLAQFMLENYREDTRLAIALYIVAGGLTVWALWKHDFSLPHPGLATSDFQEPGFRPVYLIVAVLASALTYFSAGNNLFDIPTVFLWIVSIVAVLRAFWEGELSIVEGLGKAQAWITRPEVKLTISRWMLVLLLGFGISVFFRFYRLNQVPPEMVSDHAEKLLDVLDVLNGLPSIFFPRNTGREALQFYMAAATARLFGTGISHLTLKIGTVIAGVIPLIYIYLLGKELANRRVGFLAMLLAGVAYWPNVISRVGLRFPLYPLFVAPVFYHLVRGVQQRNRNDFILCGLFLGAGLHGYSPSRVIPIIVVLAVFLLLLHRPARQNRIKILSLLLITGVVAIVVTMPLIRVAVDRPDEVIYRMASRYGSAERELPGPAWEIFLSNVWNGFKMFGWDNGEVWVNSIPHRPSLDWLTATFFHLGLVMLFIRYLRERQWLDLFLLLSIPLLQLPSTLSLAFPAENPAPNRAAGAIIPVFLIAGYAVDAIPRWLGQQWRSERFMRYGYVLVAAILLMVARINYNLVFDEYQDLFRRSAWNTSEAGLVIRNFAESIGSYESAHVVAYPHWVDTRLVAMNAGVPTRDYAIAPENLRALAGQPGPHLLLLHPEDVVALDTLKAVFPDLIVQRWETEIPGKDFVIAFTAGTSGGSFHLDEFE